MKQGILGGSWVVIGRVISALIRVISIVTILRTLPRTTHAPPSRVQDSDLQRSRDALCVLQAQVCFLNARGHGPKLSYQLS